MMKMMMMKMMMVKMEGVNGMVIGGEDDEPSFTCTNHEDRLILCTSAPTRSSLVANVCASFTNTTPSADTSFRRRSPLLLTLLSQPLPLPLPPLLLLPLSTPLPNFQARATLAATAPTWNVCC
jgi:hypothetical protein